MLDAREPFDRSISAVSEGVMTRKRKMCQSSPRTNSFHAAVDYR
jgi:hypothetical protein